FHPDEKYTTRIKNILTEYPYGSQILREILQNSDDAKSSVQIFILNHKTYPSEKLCDPKLERYQDVSSIISGSSYVLIDPHERQYCNVKPGQRGFKADFLEHDILNEVKIIVNCVS
ncbi:18183_t:CDS:2, partial [Racocetra fulgida]